jgi:superfamily II DNA or RNA helicase
MHTALPSPGDLIWIRRRRWRVARAIRDGDVVCFDVAGPNRRVTVLAPFDRPSAAVVSSQVRRARAGHIRARLAYALSSRHTIATSVTGVRAHIELLPHQHEPLLALDHGARRVLVADEVGLGKTVQAALAIAETMRRRATARVLLIVPGGLRDQWRGELLARLGLHGEIGDRDHLEALSRAGARGDNPWRRAGIWLVSADFLKQPHVIDGLPPEPWDLVVVDEAHTACGDSDRWHVCDLMVRRARTAMLLTATPHDGDRQRFTRLIDLGRLDVTGDDVVVFRRTRASIGWRTRRAIRWSLVDPRLEERRVLDALHEFEAAALAAGERRDETLLLLSVFRKRALSSMASLSISLDRRRQWIEASGDITRLDWRQPGLSLDPDLASDDERADDDGRGLTTAIDLDVRVELSWLRRLGALANAAARADSRLDRLATLLTRVRERAIVFTEFRDSAAAVVRRLAVAGGVATLHGGQTTAERSRELERFTSGDARILVATDVASIGLNLHARCRWIINLELPWNPVRLEQRAGRVDRLGQRAGVHITTVLLRHRAESPLLRRLAERVLAARRAIGADTLAATPSFDARIRDAICSGAADLSWLTAHATPTSLAICDSWRRPARMQARNLHRLRRLASRWRCDAPPAGPMRWTSAIRARVSRPDRHTFVFAIPIADGLGATLEMHVVAIESAASIADARDLRRIVAIAAHSATRSLAPRTRRLRRRLAALAPRIETRERALFSVVEAAVAASRTQGGLFDRRALDARDASDSAVAAVRDAAADGETRRALQQDVVVGRPRLIAALLA